MTRLGLTMFAAAGLALSGTAVLGCDSSRTSESAGEFVDDTVITTRVQAAILKDAALKPFQIGVKTYKDTVQLSGFVDSSQAVKRAGGLALGVQGVAKVKNDLIVK
jgi:osmotically-inducible protein OsmY